MFIGIFNTFFSFSSNGCKEIVEMFAISIGSVLAVSLETRILRIFDWLLFIFKIDFIPFQVF